MLSVEDDFVEGWQISSVLGEGAFSVVRLLENRVSKELLAIKIIDTTRCSGVDPRKEILGERIEPPLHFIFLEYVSGGELFDRINSEGDAGMSFSDVQGYFRQLLAGVEYMHSRGVAHRDLKPENLLLTDADVLKISDFGMATLFRHEGKERFLASRCGSLPYVAPEVLFGRYKAMPADIWSCGIVLVAMLAGELPWDEPTSSCAAYLDWQEKRLNVTTALWRKIDSIALSMLQNILHCDPDKRYSMAQIKKHAWLNKSSRPRRHFSAATTSDTVACVSSHLRSVCVGKDTNDCHKLPLKRKLPAMRNISDHSMHCNSQPVNAASLSTVPNLSLLQNNSGFASFSQPTSMEDLLLSTQSQLTQSSQVSSQDAYHKLVRRMTRFISTVSVEESFARICEVFDEINYFWRSADMQITATTQDSRRNELCFKISAYDMPTGVLLDFRLSRGDGLEFKRIFVKLRDHLSDILSKEPMPDLRATSTNVRSEAVTKLRKTFACVSKNANTVSATTVVKKRKA